MAGPSKAGTLLNAVTTTGRASIDLPLLPSMTLFFIKISGGTATVDLEISDDRVLFIKVVSVTTNSSVQFAIPAAVVSANVSAISGATVTVTYRTVTLDNMPTQTLVVYAGSTVTSPVISTTDHGALGGLTDDDHTQYQLESEKDAVSGYAGLNASSRVTKGADAQDDLIVDLATKGLVLKDTQGTPHYWRITVDNTGTLVISDVGTTKP